MASGPTECPTSIMELSSPIALPCADRPASSDTRAEVDAVTDATLKPNATDNNPRAKMSPVTIGPGMSADITVTVNVLSTAKVGDYNAAIYLHTTSGDRLGIVPVTLTVT